MTCFLHILVFYYLCMRIGRDVIDTGTDLASYSAARYLANLKAGYPVFGYLLPKTSVVEPVKSWPAPEKVSHTKLKLKIETKRKIFFSLSFCVKIVIIWLKLWELSQLCHLRTPKSHSNRPEPAPFFTGSGSSKKVRLRLHTTACELSNFFPVRLTWNLNVRFDCCKLLPVLLLWFIYSNW